MTKQDIISATITLTTGDQIKDVDFPNIPGRITGVSTHLIGDRYGNRVRLAIKDGGSEVRRPIDVAFSETSGRASGVVAQLPLHVANPGRITAQVQLDSVLDANQTIKVEVLIFCEIDQIC